MRYKPLSGKWSDHRCCKVISDFPRLADGNARVIRGRWEGVGDFFAEGMAYDLLEKRGAR